MENPRSQRGHWGTGVSVRNTLLDSREMSSKQMSTGPQEPEGGAQGVHLWGGITAPTLPLLHSEKAARCPPREHLESGPPNNSALQ